MTIRYVWLCAAAGLAASVSTSAQEAGLAARLDALEAQVTAAEDVSAIKRLQRTYGYYVDKGMWEDVAQLYADDAVANYPAGTYVGKDSIRAHLYRNVGAVEIGQVGLPEGRLYNHINMQPVVHLEPGGQSAKGRWRALAMIGSFGGGATWAEGSYEMSYVKRGGVWKIANLDYHSGFGAPYATGWVPPEPQPAGAGRGPRNLPHPADRPRSADCGGFPSACPGRYHYTNPGTTDAGFVWTSVTVPPSANRAAPRERAADLARRAQRLTDEQSIENLQKIFGYYFDRRMWDEVADLFATDGSIELGQSGVYVGKARVRQFLDLLGPVGVRDGELNDHVQLQIVVTVAADGRTAKARSRELAMTGVHERHGEWSEGVYENTFVNEAGVWKLKDLRFFPTFVTDYDLGWGKDAKPLAPPSTTLPPDRAPTSVYAIYPKAHIPPYHYDNVATGAAPDYGTAPGRPHEAAIAAIRAPVRSVPVRGGAAPQRDVDALVTAAEQQVARVKDYHEIDNLVSAYGFYLDKNYWNDLADLFAEHGSIELAQRGVYVSRERVRAFLFNVFGAEGPAANRLGNHLQYQAVIHVAADGQSAKTRSRMLQQLNFGPRASLGASLYENEFVKEGGRWKFSIDHTFNTWTAAYQGGWARAPGRTVPGQSRTYAPDAPPTFAFQMFPTVYEIPFHYAHPATGRATGARLPNAASGATVSRIDTVDLGMPAEIAAELRAIGPRIETQRTAELYAGLQPKEPYGWLDVRRDLRYGVAERNVLDVFAAPRAGGGKPVVVFVHGGGFARGAKRIEGTPFYDNVGLWAAGYGFVGVTMNYRLAPQSTWPSGIEDLGAAVAWLEANVAQYGGDPSKIVLWGHSAGAAHVADYVAAMTKRGADAGIAGAVLTSGFYDLGTTESVWKVYYGADVSTYAERSSLPGLLNTRVPLLVTDAELDPEMFRQEAQKLVAARAAAGQPVEHVHLAGHSHISETYAIGTGDRSLANPVRAFVQRATGAR